MKRILTSTLLTAASIFAAAPAIAQVSAQGVETSFSNYLRSAGSSVNTGNMLPNFLVKEDTKGNRYLFDDWVNGTVIGTDNVIYKPTNAKFNYDKVSQTLLMLMDNKTVMEISSGAVAGFTLLRNDSSFQFERLKNSTDLHFYEPLYKKEKGYSLYKLIETKFRKADYQTNGIVESGNKYDEYVDEGQYFILSPKGELTKIELKKKSIERALPNEASKVETFFAAHKREKIDEAFLEKLLQSLNS